MSQTTFQSLSRSWCIIALFALIGTGAGLVYSFEQVPMYEARTSYVGRFSSDDSEGSVPEDDIERLGELSSLVFTYCEILESRGVAEAAATSLDLSTERVSDYAISCDVMPDTYILTLQVRGEDPLTVAGLANAIGAVGVDEVSVLRGDYELGQLDKVVVGISPVYAQNALLGAGVGLILSVIYALVRHRSPEHKSPAAVAERDEGKVSPNTIPDAKVLVVEDEGSTARMLRAALQHEGYQVEIVHDGENALKVARDWKPNLVLLDVMLPDMKGFEVCRQLRKSKDSDTLPIIMLTARGQITDKEEAFSVGADDYLIKPVDLDELRMRVKVQLRRSTTISEEQPVAEA